MPNFRRVIVDDSYVFITVLINNRKRKLLTEYIAKLKQSLKTTKQIFKFEIYAISIMHEHLHMILRPNFKGEYPKIFSHIKKGFTKALPNDLRRKLTQEISKRKLKKRESGVWQRRFYEHTIRTETDLNHLTDYINFNPVKHGLVDRAFNWKHSSFRKFVSLGFYDENWCDFTQLKYYQ